MRLKDLKMCITSEIQERIGYSKKNLKYCSEKVCESAAGIDKDIERWGDIEAGLLYCAGAEMAYVTHSCAERMIQELRDKYLTDQDLIEAIRTCTA